jgi:hypothetical protein
VDLQLAYLAAPASAAAANAVQQGPTTAQQAGQAAFAANVERREETIEETTHVEGARVRADAEGSGNGEYAQQRQGRRPHHQAGSEDDASYDADGVRHFIDTTA